MKKVIALLLVAVLMMVTFTSCAKCISTEYENVKVTVVDKYHRSTYVTPIYNGKTTTIVTHPAVWHITVEYNDVEYTISGKDTYDKYKDKIGQAAIGQVKIRTYDDGTVKYDIVSLE